MTGQLPSQGSWSPAEETFERVRRRLGLWLGPSVAACCLLWPWLPASPAQNRLLAVMVWVITWWVTEPVPLPVSALLAPSLAAMLGVDSPQALFAPFADPVIFLFLGSFLIAQGAQRAGLDRRAALLALSSPWVRSRPARLLVACGALVAVVSLWVSNTAACAMMYPLALAVARYAGFGERSPFVKALLLATAYAASIGGIGTPVGTPPNLIAMGQLARMAGRPLSFLDWMAVGLPVSLALLALTLAYLAWLARRGSPGRPASAPWQAGEKLPPLSRREKNVLVVFFLAVVLWVGPSSMALLLGSRHPLAARLAALFPESVVALLAGSLFFLLPAEKGRRTLSWQEALQVDWGTLLLFGGGLCLGQQMARTGLAARVGEWLVTATGASSLLLLTYLFTLVAVLLTEIASNTAAATITCPLAIAAAQAAGVSPVPPAMAAAIGASLAFMLPVSTPPNAIVYGSGLLRVTDLLRAGAFLDALALLINPPLVVLLCRLWGLSP